MSSLPTNEELLAEIKLCKQSSQLSTELVNMFSALVTSFFNLKKFEYFSQEWKDKVSESVLNEIKRVWHHFNPEKSDKPIQYYRVVIVCAFSHFKSNKMNTVVEC